MKKHGRYFLVLFTILTVSLGVIYLINRKEITTYRTNMKHLEHIQVVDTTTTVIKEAK